MTSDGYCTLGEFAGLVNRRPDVIRSWVKTKKITLPTDKKKVRGRDVYKASDLTEEYNRHVAETEAERKQREEKKVATGQPIKIRKESNYSKGAWGAIKLDPIIIPEILPESQMTPYRSLGWQMLINAALDLASPCMSDKRNRTPAQHELTVSNAKRWLSGESDPEMLSLACELAGISEKWIKEKVATIKQYPSRTEMKRMLSQWRAQVGSRKEPSVKGRLQCYMDCAADQNDIHALYDSLPHLAPVSQARQHNRQVAIGP